MIYKEKRVNPQYILVFFSVFTLLSLLLWPFGNLYASTTTDTLLGYWKFDDGTGLNVTDYSDSGIDGTIVTESVQNLSLTPNPGSLTASWVPVVGNNNYSLRYSTDQSNWTEVTGITDSYYEITGLDYSTTYFVQVKLSADSSESWGATVSDNPLIDPSSDLSVLFSDSNITLAKNYGDQVPLEIQTFTIAWRFRQHEIDTARGLIGLQANLQSTGGWQRAGVWVRNDTDNRVDLFGSVGGNWETNTSTGTYTKTDEDYIWILSKSGTTLSLDEYDPSTGTVSNIVQETLSSADINYNTSFANPRTTLNTVFSGSSGMSLASKATTREMLIASDTPTTTVKAELGRYLDKRHEVFDNPVEYFVDEGFKSSGSLAPVVQTPTKSPSNPIFEPSTPNSDGGIRWGSIQYDSVNDKYHYWGSVKKESDNSLRAMYAESVDGVTWTNQTEFTPPVGDAVITSAVIDSPNVYVLAERSNSGNGMYVFSTTINDPTNLTLENTVYTGNDEGKDLGMFEDGRLYIYYTQGHLSERRSTGVYGAVSDDPSSLWVDFGIISGLTSTAANDQYYSHANIIDNNDYTIGVGPKYDSTTETLDLSLFASRSDSLGSVSRVDENWIPRGGSGEWDDTIIWEVEDFQRIGNEWWIYYNGFPELHGDDPNYAAIGLATIDYGRIGSISNSGNWVTDVFRVDNNDRLKLNSNTENGAITAEVLDSSGSVISGYSSSDFDSFSGNGFDQYATWNGRDLPSYKDIQIRFTFAENATLYSYEIEESGGNAGITTSGSSNQVWSENPSNNLTYSNPFAINLDGFDDYVTLTDFSPGNTFTFSFWINPSSTSGSQGFISKKDTDGSNQFSFGFSDATYELSLGALSVAGGTKTTGWQHILLSIDEDTGSSDILVYKDGNLIIDDTLATTLPVDVSGEAWALGTDFDESLGLVNPFEGLIDDLRIWNRTLESSEIQDLASGAHLSAVWDGSSSTDWEDPANWDIGYVPDNYTNINIPNTVNDPAFSTNIELVDLSIQENASLDISTYNLTMNDGGEFSNVGTFSLEGSNTLANFTNDSDSGTIEYSGSGSYSNLLLGNTYNDLVFSGMGSYTLNSDLDVNRDLNIDNGTLSADGNNINLEGDWNLTNGSFVHGGNSVILDGANQSIFGDNTFNNLRKEDLLNNATAVNLTFEAGSTQNIEGTFTIKGMDANDMVQLISSTPGAQWLVNPNNRDISYVNVTDSNNISSSDILCQIDTCVDGGNNTRWIFTDQSDDPGDDADDDSPSNQAGSSSNSNSNVGNNPLVALDNPSSETNVSVEDSKNEDALDSELENPQENINDIEVSNNESTQDADESGGDIINFIESNLILCCVMPLGFLIILFFFLYMRKKKRED